MKKLIPALILTLALPALAETATFKVTGMHCGSCEQSVEAAVCKKMEGVTACKAKIINEKKETGELTITTAEGTTLDAKKVEELISASGEFHIRKSSKK